MKAIFTHKPQSIYNDLPEDRYHFPRTYLRQIEQTVGDFIVYYEPGRTGTDERDRTGRQAYVATARVRDLAPDPQRPDHSYALIDSDTYVEFDRPVPFRVGEHYYERQLRREDGGTNKGAFGRAVRLLAEDEYEAILAAGFARELATVATSGSTEPSVRLGEHLMEDPAKFDRPIIDRVMSRPVRDAAFAARVRAVYAETCAITGLKIINGGGRAEVQAAHIRPVSERGPDSVRNGLALSGTVHWLFDRGLISVGPPPRYEILISRRGLPDRILQIFNADRRALVPDHPHFRPAPTYLDFHREHVFKG